MVVTRRTPVVPSPPVSRSQSSQGVPRPARASLTQDITPVAKSSSPLASVEAQVASTSTANGVEERTYDADKHSEKNTKKNKSKKHGKNKRRKSNFQAFLDFLTRLLLLAFIIYSASVCPQDAHQQTPLCRGLTEYKRIVLDPYIISPLQTALAHPSVALYVDRAMPYVHHAIEVTTPVISRAQTEWNLHVIPQWEKYVVPEWEKRIIPHWRRHVVPRLEVVQETFAPYGRRIEHVYEQSFAPRAQLALYNLQRWQRQARPYILLAVSKTHEGYNAAKPYTAPLIRQIGLALHQLALFLQEQRQKFVDPHVSKIWEKVEELSKGRQTSDEPEQTADLCSPDPPPQEAVAEPESPAEVYLPEPSPLITELPNEPLTSTISPSAAAMPQTVSEEAELTPTEPLATLAASITSTTHVHNTAQPAVEFTQELPEELAPMTEAVTASTETEPFLSAESVLVETLRATVHSSVVPSVTEGVHSSDYSDYSTLSHDSVIIPTSQPTVGSAGRATLSGNNDEIDMGAFYAELGLDEDLGALNDYEEPSVVPPQPAETEEERAERQRLKAEETARKRADIEARHSKWEQELQAQMERSTTELQTRLQTLRKAAAAELSSSAEIRDAIEHLASEAEKYIKGAEIYLKNLKGENRKREEKLALWDRVVQKVSNKFTERLHVAKATVNSQYKGILELESREVATAIAKVQDVAEKGQVDLGLDYAWLDDVTYHDWQRYHELMEVSNKYADQAVSVQNGTHSAVVAANPLVPIIQDVESELGDIIIGFETRLRRIKRDGERAFNSNGAAQKEEEKASAAEPDVSILPIPGTDTAESARTFIPPVIIGRSSQEVLDALKMAQSSDQQSVNSGDKLVDPAPEETLSSLVHEAEGVEVRSAGSGGSLPHTEL